MFFLIQLIYISMNHNMHWFCNLKNKHFLLKFREDICQVFNFIYSCFHVVVIFYISVSQNLPVKRLVNSFLKKILYSKSRTLMQVYCSIWISFSHIHYLSTFIHNSIHSLQWCHCDFLIRYVLLHNPDKRVDYER